MDQSLGRGRITADVPFECRASAGDLHIGRPSQAMIRSPRPRTSGTGHWARQAKGVRSASLGKCGVQRAQPVRETSRNGWLDLDWGRIVQLELKYEIW